MGGITVYYDETDKRCRAYADFFAQHERVACKKASDFMEQNMIFEKNRIVGFLYSSSDSKIPYAVSHVIWRLSMNRTARCFIMVTGGAKEFRSLKAAVGDLEKRGYRVTNGYTQYYFDKRKMDPKRAVKKMIEDARGEEGKTPIRLSAAELKTGMSLTKNLRRRVQSAENEYEEEREEA